MLSSFYQETANLESATIFAFHFFFGTNQHARSRSQTGFSIDSIHLLPGSNATLVGRAQAPPLDAALKA
jgi:hypothetical protein